MEPGLQTFLDEDRWTSVFPLPLVPRPQAYRGDSSRIRTRRGRRAQIRALANRILLGLNALNRGLPRSRTHGSQQPRPEVLLVHRAVHASVLREASRFERARRGLPTGGPTRGPEVDIVDVAPYMRLTRTSTKQVPIVASALVEPRDDGEVDMLAALPERDSAFYADEANLVAGDLLPAAEIDALTARYGFIGGTYDEFVKYLRRSDLPARLWHFDTLASARAICGFSAVLKKNGRDQRKLLMAVPTNAQWVDAKRRAKLGMHGGGAFSLLHAADGGWHVAAFDAENAFTRVATPRWW